MRSFISLYATKTKKTRNIQNRQNKEFFLIDKLFYIFNETNTKNHYSLLKLRNAEHSFELLNMSKLLAFWDSNIKIVKTQTKHSQNPEIVK